MPGIVQQALIVPVLLLGLVLLALVGAFLGAPFWWADITQSFSWDLRPRYR